MITTDAQFYLLIAIAAAFVTGSVSVALIARDARKARRRFEQDRAA